MKKITGFTLIELIIVVAMIGLLSAIIYPSYQESILKTKRVVAQAEMLELAQRLQRFKIANFSYISVKDNDDQTSEMKTPVTLKDLNHGGVLPSEGDEVLYDLVLSDVGLTTWLLTATPRTGSVMAGNGVICLNHRNERFWVKSAIQCTLSSTSNWDGT